MAKSPSPKKEADVEEIVEVTAKKPASKKKLIIAVATVLLLGGGGGGGAWYMLKGKHSTEGEAQAKPVKEARREKTGAPPVFLALESIVVNLRAQAPQATDQFLQTDMTLRLAGQDVVDQIKLHMPEVRNRVIMLLSTKTSQELLTAEGKTALAESLRAAITAVIDPDSVKPVEGPRLKKEDGEGDTAAEAAEETPAEENQVVAEEAPSPEDFKVKSVLFTSFIIQ